MKTSTPDLPPILTCRKAAKTIGVTWYILKQAAEAMGIQPRHITPHPTRGTHKFFNREEVLRLRKHITGA